MSLGARLTELRLRKGASLQDVADAVEASKTHIWALEKGGTKNPSLDLLKKLAEHFNVTVEYLAGTGDTESLVEVEAQQFFRDFKLRLKFFRMSTRDHLQNGLHSQRHLREDFQSRPHIFI